MGLTKPVVPVDQASITPEVMRRVLSAAGTGLVLAGGQALLFWMKRYQIGPPSTTGSQGHAGVTCDADFLGTAAMARQFARALNARLEEMPAETLSSLAAQIRIPAGHGLEHNIDVIHHLYAAGGLRKTVEFTKRTQRRALTAQLEEGWTIRVLHPLDVLASRIHNAADLVAVKGPHVVTQARWGIEVARAAMTSLLNSDEAGGERPGALVQEICRLALSQSGRKVFKDHGVETAAAIPFELMSAQSSARARQARTIYQLLQKHRRTRDVEQPE